MEFSNQSPEEKLKLGKVLGKVVKVLPIVSGFVPVLAPINTVVQAGVQIARVIKK